ncbi:MAG: SsrA-binding protein SmpB [Ruminococcus sp.]|nr:SsrA-binding protein SmpB [Ruminococcus sp.]
MSSDTIKTVAKNKKAYHDYFIEETFEAGIELKGSEVKSIRAGRVNLKDSWCSIVKGEIFVNGLHISVYEQGAVWCKDPLRVRKLLMHKKEIMKLFGQTQQQGYSIIPLSVYFKGNNIKLSIGLCKGKKLYDKRDDMARKSAKRAIERELKERNYRG